MQHWSWKKWRGSQGRTIRFWLSTKGSWQIEHRSSLRTSGLNVIYPRELTIFLKSNCFILFSFFSFCWPKIRIPITTAIKVMKMPHLQNANRASTTRISSANQRVGVCHQHLLLFAKKSIMTQSCHKMKRACMQRLMILTQCSLRTLKYRSPQQVHLSSTNTVPFIIRVVIIVTYEILEHLLRPLNRTRSRMRKM